MSTESQRSFPWSWNPGERIQTSNKLFEEVVANEHFDWETERASLLVFCEAAMQQYVIPSDAADMVDTYLLGLPTENTRQLRELTVTAHDEESYQAVLYKFEKKLLGLGAEEGLRHYDSPTGFSGGIYPADSVSRTVGLSSEDLYTYLGDVNEMKRIMLRSGNFIFSVVGCRNKEIVRVGEITELTEIGNATVEALLGAYAYGSSRNTNLNGNAL